MAWALSAELSFKFLVAGLIVSMKISDDPIGNQTRNLPAYRAVS